MVCQKSFISLHRLFTFSRSLQNGEASPSDFLAKSKHESTVYPDCTGFNTLFTFPGFLLSGISHFVPVEVESGIAGEGHLLKLAFWELILSGTAGRRI